ncbi:MAG: porin family protein [Cyclobacteriaceae bacterium]|nr:porin family protein [Cyclobacteriaceae bacterium]
MKKLIIMFSAILISAHSYAQFNKGRILAGGNVGFSNHTYKTKSAGNSANTMEKSSMFSLTPQVGYFVIDNLAVGAGLDLSVTSIKPEADISDQNNFAFQFQPFVRYYVEPGFFVQGSYGLGSSKEKQSYQGSSQEQKYSISGWSIAAGYALFINDRVALEPLLGYKSETSKDKEFDYKYIDSGLFFKLGLQVYLRD